METMNGMLERFSDSLLRNKEKNALLLDTYSEQAAEDGILKETARLPHVSEADRVMRRRRMRIMRAYAAHLFTNMAEGMQGCEDAFLLLDPDGCIVQMRTSSEFEERLSAKGIGLGTVWRADVTGSDAVAIGVAERCAMQSAGTENYLSILQDMAVYYAPLQVMEAGLLRNMGGVAWICPYENGNEAYMLLALGFASAMNIRVSTSWNICESYEGNAEGVVQLDINTVNGEVSMTHHNRRFWDVLRLPPMERWDSYFKPISDLIDPLPDNARLWEIIHEQREVRDQEITIQVQGRKHNRVITTVSTTHPELKSKGLQLYITTRKDISHQVADKTGNNAVMSFHDIVGNSSIMKNRIKRAKLLASTESNIMLLGESGVGKDVFAQAIHNQSHRRGGPFVSVNCGALPRDLIASELFGYDAGAFTGAKKQGNIGKFELAEGGTLFLDEIGEMPLDLQATLLRAVEQKQFMRLGSNKVVKADVRIISATNVDINRMIREKRFRSDLYYRLSTMSMDIPPLRERGEDAVLLAESFIRKISRKIGRQEIMELTPEAKQFLLSCPWYGNVRELQNLADCLVQLYPDRQITLGLIRENVNPAYFQGQTIKERLVETGLSNRNPSDGGYLSGSTGNTPFSGSTGSSPFYGSMGSSPFPGSAGSIPSPGSTGSIPSSVSSGEPDPGPARSAFGGENRRDLPLLTKEEILDALKVCEGNRSKAAKYLNVGRRTLYRYIDKLGIGDKQYN